MKTNRRIEQENPFPHWPYLCTRRNYTGHTNGSSQISSASTSSFFIVLSHFPILWPFFSLFSLHFSPFSFTLSSHFFFRFFSLSPIFCFFYTSFSFFFSISIFFSHFLFSQLFILLSSRSDSPSSSLSLIPSSLSQLLPPSSPIFSNLSKSIYS